jgi:BASS family bile acid:Na+ symporter
MRRPGVIAIAVIAQFLLLPALTFVLTLLLDVRASVALGMILVACCPPGNVSNIVTHRSGGDVALSVSITAVSNVLAVVLMPLNFAFWGGIHPTGGDLIRSIDVSLGSMLLEIALVILVPFAAGIAIGRLWPRVASVAQRILGPLALIALLAIIVIAVANNWSILVDHLGVVLFATAVHDALAMLLGFWIGRVTRVGLPGTKALTFEVGMRNTSLGMLVAFGTFGGLGGMALVTAWWGIWDIITGLALAEWWRRRTVRRSAPETVAA